MDESEETAQWWRQWQSFREASGYGGLGAMGGTAQANSGDDTLTVEKIREVVRETKKLQAHEAGETLARRIVKVCRLTAITPIVRAQLKAEALSIVADKTGQDPVLLGAMADGVRHYLTQHNIPVRF